MSLTCPESKVSMICPVTKGVPPPRDGRRSSLRAKTPAVTGQITGTFDLRQFKSFARIELRIGRML
jgi:hypothetical protein